MKRLVFILLLGLLFSCSTSVAPVSGDIIRQPENVPDAFIPEEGVSLDKSSCKSPMKDPRDGTELKMIRSNRGVGDYEVPEGKYGIQKRELLRLDCQTGEVAGVVKQ